jgi:two-component system, sensor histidine kinase LadS
VCAAGRTNRDVAALLQRRGTDTSMRLTTKNDQLSIPVQLSPVWAAALVIGALLLVFGLDRATGSAPVQHLYYLPIILAGLGFGMPGGIVAALWAIVLYHVANPRLLTFRYGESDLVQILLFLGVGVITAKLTLDANRLRRLAMTDDLTGLHNLRSFEARLAAMVRASRQTQAPIALLVLDVDRLKSLNDRYGHLTGAEAVRMVGHIIGRRLTPDATACRYGGDEFAVAIPRCTESHARDIAADLCRAIHESSPVLAGRPFPAGTLSISVGGACVSLDRHAASRGWAPGDPEAGEALFRAADAALYRAKAGGRNRVYVESTAASNEADGYPGALIS